MEGKVCFDLFADRLAMLLEGSVKIRRLVATIYPWIIFDEFQDTSADQWRVVKALGEHCKLITLADPEQRIFEFIGADPARLSQFQEAFKPTFTELGSDNHRSNGTDILLFGNEILTGKFSKSEYVGVTFNLFQSNKNQAYGTLVGQVLQARKRLIDSGQRGWSIAILVPTKKKMRIVSDVLRSPFGNVPPIGHSASIDTEGPILGAEVIAHLLQQEHEAGSLDNLVQLMCHYFRGRGGSNPGKGDLAMAVRFEAALKKWKQRVGKGLAPQANSVLKAVNEALTASQEIN